MKYLLPAAILMLMLSIGMSLRFRELVSNWRRLSAGSWARLLLATFILPPAIALLLGQALSLDRAAMAGLFLVGPAALYPAGGGLAVRLCGGLCLPSLAKPVRMVHAIGRVPVRAR